MTKIVRLGVFDCDNGGINNGLNTIHNVIAPLNRNLPLYQPPIINLAVKAAPDCENKPQPRPLPVQIPPVQPQPKRMYLAIQFAAVDITTCQSQSGPLLKMPLSHPDTKEKVKRAPPHRVTTRRKAKNAGTAAERTANAPSTIRSQECIPSLSPNRLSRKTGKHAINVRMENANVLTANAPTALSHLPRERANNESQFQGTYRAVSDTSKLLLVILTFKSKK
jgi:hypothetical protein